MPGVALAATFEIPYASVRPPDHALDHGRVDGMAMTPAGAAAFGRSLAAAALAWLDGLA